MGFLLLPSKVHVDAINDCQYHKAKMATNSDMYVKYGLEIYKNCTINYPKMGHFEDAFTNLDKLLGSSSSLLSLQSVRWQYCHYCHYRGTWWHYCHNCHSCHYRVLGGTTVATITIVTTGELGGTTVTTVTPVAIVALLATLSLPEMGKTYEHASNACVNFLLARVKSVPNFTFFCCKNGLCRYFALWWEILMTFKLVNC